METKSLIHVQYEIEKKGERMREGTDDDDDGSKMTYNVMEKWEMILICGCV